MSSNNGNKSEIDYANKQRQYQLVVLGVVSILLGALCAFICVVVYKLPMLSSISQSATTGVQAGMILPFGLGMMVLFAITYKSYCLSERIIVILMGIGFALVAMQPCYSSYLAHEPSVGLLGLPPKISDIVHLIGAAMGFGLMAVWIMFYFTKTDKTKIPTSEKLRRNAWYRFWGGGVFISILLLCLCFFVDFGPIGVFVAEELALFSMGMAVLVKGGAFFRDKHETS